MTLQANPSSLKPQNVIASEPKVRDVISYLQQIKPHFVRAFWPPALTARIINDYITPKYPNVKYKHLPCIDHSSKGFSKKFHKIQHSYHYYPILCHSYHLGSESHRAS